MILLQMHGEPGSGKTTLARELARRIPALHLDKDVISSAIMQARVPGEVAGPASYQVMRDQAKAFLAQGYSVILDSPAYWPVIEQKAKGLARVSGAAYFMIETICPDAAEIERRLTTRERLLSNPVSRFEGLAAGPGTREPFSERLVLDSRRPLEELVERALAYLGAGVAP